MSEEEIDWVTMYVKYSPFPLILTPNICKFLRKHGILEGYLEAKSLEEVT